MLHHNSASTGGEEVYIFVSETLMTAQGDYPANNREKKMQVKSDLKASRTCKNARQAKTKDRG